jgi:hypothetical protein
MVRTGIALISFLCNCGVAVAQVPNVDSAPPIALERGQRKSASLPTGDRNLAGIAADAYSVLAEVGEILTIHAEAEGFTPLLMLLENDILVPSGTPPDERRARMTFAAPRSGTFTIVVSRDPAVRILDSRTGYWIEVVRGFPAELPRWIRVTLEDGQADYVDVRSVAEVRPGIWSAWGTTFYAEPQRTDGDEWNLSSIHYEADCNRKRIRIVDGYLYNRGRVIGRSGPIGGWMSWAPQSRMEGTAGAICAAADAR